MIEKFYLKTLGCQMNFSDSQRITSFLEKNLGLKKENLIKDSDLVIFNTCGVRQSAENRMFGQVHNIRKKHPEIKIIITGCLSKRKDVITKISPKVDLFVSIQDFFLLNKKDFEKLEKANQNNKQFKKNGSKKINCHYFSIDPEYRDKDSIFVPIMTGCNNFCSYCVVPYARGREVSRNPGQIIDEIRKAFYYNCQKVTLLGQNVNSYKFKDFDFPKLLDKLAKKFPKIKFDFLTSHPKDFSDELIKVIYENKNISKSIHLPVQSGSDKILKAMNRPYTKKHYLNLIEKIKAKIPKVKFSTDIIIGFPGETQKDFNRTVKVFKKVKFYQAFLNKYSPRPGTKAFKLGDPVDWSQKKQREKILKNLINQSKN
ncbi:MAG: tRNA (N6-isopentenyl adenosine(37)-C2)-methylthiotransferase MiaB [Candidatus Moranbacteria bacterium]|nr:tRNA (N6-isopentenyl adenosine(37)-C2)-methylthiotransferase MiaB [Candidatus Moranbacteria bacterium]